MKPNAVQSLYGISVLLVLNGFPVTALLALKRPFLIHTLILI